MKKIIAIVFLFSYLFSATECRQLLKIPLLIAHFSEHRKEDKNLSLFEFLRIHYAHGSPIDADYEKDMQLPFKTVDNTAASFASGYLSFLCTSENTRKNNLKSNSYIISNEGLPNAAHLSAIWQPPKFS